MLRLLIIRAARAVLMAGIQRAILHQQKSDYKSIRTKTVNVQGYGSVTLNKAFLKQVTIEGFGKTKEGWYISCSPETPHWYITKAPLDELDNELVSGQNCCCRLQSYTF